ncbi:MAG: hypothetical protein IH963_09335 [Chloroflexi bacterium]|nr:hypothetical protein [Chloroflexota bacterium]
MASRYGSLFVPSALFSEDFVTLNVAGNPGALAMVFPDTVATIKVTSSAAFAMLQFPSAS